MIDMASVYAERYKQNPQALQAAVMGQSPDPKLDPYTALNALRLVKESNMMAMSGKAQQPTSGPSIVSEAMTPPQGLGAMMPMGAPAARLPPQPQQAPQAPVMQASGGLAGMYTPEEDYANGGIVAFSGPTKENNNSLVTDPDLRQQVLDTIDAEGGAQNYADMGDAPQSVQARATAAQQAHADFDPAEMTPEEIKKVRQDYFDFIRGNAGEDIYAPAKERLTAREAALASDRRQGEGLAYLTAAGKILKGHNLAMGASEALPAFAQQIGEVQKAEQQEKRAIEQMNFSLADAQRKERMGDARGAQAAVESARKFQQDANKAKGDKLRFNADITTRNVQYARLARGTGAGSGPKLAERLADAEETYALSPTAENKARLAALSSAAAKMKTTFSTSENAPNKQTALLAPVQERIDAKVADSMKSFPTMNTAYRKAQREGNPEEAQRLWNAEETKWRNIHSKAEKAVGGTSGNNPPVIKLD